MVKFMSSCEDFEVLTHSRPLPLYLNRQVITLLSCLGVSENVFLRKQREYLNISERLSVIDEVH